MLETLKKLLVDELQIDPATITPDAELSSDLGINSIELANLIMLCEEKFDVTIDDDDIHKLVTVGDAIKYIDGTEIKDVIIDGNKTVMAGIRTENQVAANFYVGQFVFPFGQCLVQQDGEAHGGGVIHPVAAADHLHCLFRGAQLGAVVFLYGHSQPSYQI